MKEHTVELYGATCRDVNDFGLLFPLAMYGDIEDCIRKNPEYLKEHGGRWIESIAKSMEFLHAKDIVHFDLKPQHILINEDLQPRICDFGSCGAPSGHDPLSHFTIKAPKALTQHFGDPASVAARLDPDTKIDDLKRYDVYSFAQVVSSILYRNTGPAEINQVDSQGDFKLDQNSVWNRFLQRHPVFTPIIETFCNCRHPVVAQRPTFSALVGLMEGWDLNAFVNTFVDFADEERKHKINAGPRGLDAAEQYNAPRQPQSTKGDPNSADAANAANAANVMNAGIISSCKHSF